MPRTNENKTGVPDAGSKTRKGCEMMAEVIQSMVDSVRKHLGCSRNKAKTQSAEMVAKAINVQRSAFDKAFKIAADVQERTDKMIVDQVKDAAWMPEEGRKLVQEWSRTLASGWVEFKKTVDKSYDLLGAYLERVKEQEKISPKKLPAKNKVAAKVAPKKAVVKKPALAKAGA